MLYNGRKVYFDKKGYALVWIGGRDKKIHILEWEKYNGKKPKGFQIHHKDNDKKYWDISNLVLVTQSDHFRIHAGWIRKNGEWIAKPCKDCKQKLPLNKFYQRKGMTPSNRCIKCSSILFKKKLKDNPTYREEKRIYLKNYYKKNKVEILFRQREKYANL